MGKHVGLWLDHREAHLMIISGKNEEMRLIDSGIEQQLRHGENSPHAGHFESQLMQADDSREKSRSGHLNAYYDAIIASIRGADAILVFGPGEAKDEFVKRLKGTDLCQRVETVETADKMTDHQIASKIREYYSKRPAAKRAP